MALKTQPTKESVKTFLDGIEDEQRRKDCKAIAKMMAKATGKRPKMWGDAIVGYGRYEYKYKSGHEGAWFLTGFSPRKRDLTLYIMQGFKAHAPLMEKLGKYKNGKSCLYIKKLEDVDTDVLQQLIDGSLEYLQRTYETDLK